MRKNSDNKSDGKCVRGKIPVIAAAVLSIILIASAIVAVCFKTGVFKNDSESKEHETSSAAITSETVKTTESTSSETQTESETVSETTSKPITTVTSTTQLNFTVSDCDKTMYTKDKTNLRTVPDKNGKLILVIGGNEAVKITGICSNGWYRVEYNGKTGYSASSNFSETKIKKTGYLLKVNRVRNTVTVYKADDNGDFTVPVKAMVCSVGLNGNTPKGTYKTTDKYVWKWLYGDVYGQYATRITGHILFHSVPYYTQNKNDLEYDEYNKLGQAASLGCVRLCVRDAKWIYDNCKSGTEVIIYDSNDPEPITPTAPVRIDTSDERRGWDPTDPDPKNPWRK